MQFIFRELLEHNNITFNDNGTMTYFPNRSIIYVPEMSKNDPKKDMVRVPNVPILVSRINYWIYYVYHCQTVECFNGMELRSLSLWFTKRNQFYHDFRAIVTRAQLLYQLFKNKKIGIYFSLLFLLFFS